MADSEKTDDKNDFWLQLTEAQQEEIKEATIEINRGASTDYEIFIAKHR
jgi:hypothetical protein